jgi:hypothetical protein
VKAEPIYTNLYLTFLAFGLNNPAAPKEKPVKNKKVILY